MARDGMTIKSDAWQLDNYRRNPVVLWAHDYVGQHLPIGRADARVEEGQLVADIVFDREDGFAAQVESKYRRGFLNAVSVGWDTLKNDGAKVTRAELLDISAVPVPGDPDALIQRQARALQALAAAEASVMQSGLGQEQAEQEVTMADGNRVGAVLSKRNSDDLEQAIELIRGVIARAKHEDAEAKDAKETDVETERVLRAILEKLEVKNE